MRLPGWAPALRRQRRRPEPSAPEPARPACVLHVTAVTERATHGPAAPAAENNPLLNLEQLGLCHRRNTPRSSSRAQSRSVCSALTARAESMQTSSVLTQDVMLPSLCHAGPGFAPRQNCTASWTRFGFSCSGFVPFDARLGDEEAALHC